MQHSPQLVVVLIPNASIALTNPLLKMWQPLPLFLTSLQVTDPKPTVPLGKWLDSRGVRIISQPVKPRRTTAVPAPGRDRKAGGTARASGETGEWKIRQKLVGMPGKHGDLRALPLVSLRIL
jgi:hypothetical protein